MAPTATTAAACSTTSPLLLHPRTLNSCCCCWTRILRPCGTSKQVRRRLEKAEEVRGRCFAARCCTDAITTRAEKKTQPKETPKTIRRDTATPAEGPMAQAPRRPRANPRALCPGLGVGSGGDASATSADTGPSDGLVCSCSSGGVCAPDLGERNRGSPPRLLSRRRTPPPSGIVAAQREPPSPTPDRMTGCGRRAAPLPSISSEPHAPTSAPAPPPLVPDPRSARRRRPSAPRAAQRGVSGSLCGVTFLSSSSSPLVFAWGASRALGRDVSGGGCSLLGDRSTGISAGCCDQGTNGGVGGAPSPARLPPDVDCWSAGSFFSHTGKYAARMGRRGRPSQGAGKEQSR